MNWAAVAAVCAICGVLTTIISVAYLSGRLSQRINAHDDRLDGHNARLDGHEAKLGTHSEDLALLRGWRQGFNAARGGPETSAPPQEHR